MFHVHELGNDEQKNTRLGNRRGSEASRGNQTFFKTIGSISHYRQFGKYMFSTFPRLRTTAALSTGVPVVNTHVAAALIQMARAAGLLGARVIMVGVRPEIAQSIVSLNIDLGTIETHTTLGSALQLLLRRQAVT